MWGRADIVDLKTHGVDLSKAKDIRNLHCGGNMCVAVREDGSAITWGSPRKPKGADATWDANKKYGAKAESLLRKDVREAFCVAECHEKVCKLDEKTKKITCTGGFCTPVVGRRRLWRFR